MLRICHDFFSVIKWCLQLCLKCVFKVDCAKIWCAKLSVLWYNCNINKEQWTYWWLEYLGSHNKWVCLPKNDRCSKVTTCHFNDIPSNSLITFESIEPIVNKARAYSTWARVWQASGLNTSTLSSLCLASR